LDISLDIYEYFAEMLLKFWKFSLYDRFPDKKFEFIYGTEPDDYGPTLTFFQIS